MEGWTSLAAASIDGIQRKANAEQLEILTLVRKVIDDVTGHITGEASHTIWKQQATLALSQTPLMWLLIPMLLLTELKSRRSLMTAMTLWYCGEASGAQELLFSCCSSRVARICF